MTERLTKREKNGLAYFPMCFTPPCNGEGCKDENCIFINDVCERLAEYEDLEEQGRLLRLPCKVGDTVYKITRNFISEYKIISATIYPYSIQFNWQCTKGIYGNLVGFADLEIGKTVFLTREEAEAKLKEMEESHERE